MVQPNYRFRALTTNQAEVKAVRDAFARSVIWSFPIAAASGDRVLVDATEFLVRDAPRWPAALTPGAYRFEREAQLDLPADDAELSEEHRDGGRADVRPPARRRRRRARRRAAAARSKASADVAATAEAASIRMHHSIVELPDANYKPRAYDPRSGFGGMSYENYSAPLGEPMTQRFIRRHRLAEEGSDRGDQRSGQADRLLPRSRRARADPLGVAGRRALVEPGVRGGRLSQRLPASRCCPRASARSTSATTSSTGCTARRAAGARRQRRRSAHRRNHQGRRRARLAARRAGLHDCRGTAEPVQDRRRNAAGARAVGAGADAPARRPRGRSHARPRAQLLRQRRPGRISVLDYPQPLVKLKADGTLDYSEVYAAASARGTRSRSPTATRTFPRAPTKPRRSTKILDDAWAEGPPLHDQPGHERATRASTSGRTAPTRPPS